MGPRCQNGPKKVPILLPSPKFLILPSDDAEKGRHICSSQGTAMTIWTYTMHVSCTYLWYSLALSYLLIYFELSNVATTRFLLLLHFFFFLFMKITTKAPERSKNGPKKVPILPKILSPKSHILYYSACLLVIFWMSDHQILVQRLIWRERNLNFVPNSERALNHKKYDKITKF